MRCLIAICFAALIPSVTFGQSVVLPAEIKATPGAWVRIDPVKVDGGKVSWRVDPALGEADLSKLLPVDVTTKLKIAGIDSAKLFPPDTLAKLPGRVLEIKPDTPPGRYRVEAWTAKADVASPIATCWVVVGDVPAPPKPTPPVPPKPVPPTPDAFTAALKKCFDADPAAATAKNGQRILLQGLYEAMADHARDAQFENTGQLLAKLRDVASKMISPGMLVECRKLIAAEVVATIGDENSPYDAATRAKGVAVFTKIAKALSEVR